MFLVNSKERVVLQRGRKIRSMLMRWLWAIKVRSQFDSDFIYSLVLIQTNETI